MFKLTNVIEDDSSIYRFDRKEKTAQYYRHNVIFE